MICPRCLRGEHLHDQTPAGAVADCPYQATPGDVHSVCSCDWRGLDVATVRHGITELDAQHDAIRGIAAAVVRARARTNSMGQLRPGDATDLLLECERQLSALVAVGAVPPPPDPRRSRLT